MKFLILFFIFSFSAMASNWVPVSVIQSKGSAGFQLEADCKTSSHEQCIDVGNDPSAISLGMALLSDEMVDDMASPIWATRSMVEQCSDEADCKARHEIKQCTDGRSSYYSVDDLEVWCNKIIGYNKKASGKKILSIDQDALTIYKSSQTARAQAEALISNGAKARAACLRVLDLIGGFNLLPGRSSEQAGQMAESFAVAKQALQDGRPTAAKTAIQAIPVDGVLVSQAMKDLALDQLKDW